LIYAIIILKLVKNKKKNHFSNILNRLNNEMDTKEATKLIFFAVREGHTHLTRYDSSIHADMDPMFNF
jgi:hypothetical protein